MSANPQNFPVCPNGHRQPVAVTKFCIYCGVAITVVAAVPQQPAQQQQHHPPQPVQPPQPPQQQQQVPPANGAHQQQQQYQQQQYQQQPPPPPNYGQQQYQYPPPQYQQQPSCRTCGGNGQGLPDKAVICKECRWLRPLVPGYAIDNAAFAWAADAKAMAALRAIKPLNAAAKAVSEKVGRRWIEVAFNGVLLGEKQMPHIFGQAVRAGRILGMSHMPDVYLSGDRAWDCLTFGSDNDSFIVVGSAVAGNFQGVDMLYLLAREMGHAKAGHALWKTVIRFFLGEQGPARGFMSGGILANILSPSAMIGGALEMPLLAWARQAEITADRAGLLAVGSEEIARRALLSWSLKSSFIFKQMNIDAWLEQQAEDDGDLLRLSELTTTSTPYIGPRLKLLGQYAQSPEFQYYFNRIKATLAQAAPPKPQAKEQPKELKIKCSTCGAPMKIPMSVLEGKPKLSVKCPDAKCGKVTVIRKNANKAPAAPKLKQENQDYAD
ncbi:MAG: M48 family metallopeptidase [bacterium]|nr:M48 family metallopeptidase [bacterium]